MDDGKEKFVIEKLHSTEQVKTELRDALGAGKLKVTIGMLESLWLLDSPYLQGGKVEPKDLEVAMEIIPHGDMNPVAFHSALVDTIKTAWRIWEIVVPDNNGGGKESEYEVFYPEWVTDVISQACRAVPSLTLKEALWEVPIAMLFHLGTSASRRNGAITRRPDDMKAAISRIKEHNAKKKNGNKEN